VKYLAALLVLVGCSDVLPPGDLQDPNTCKSCHPKHFTEWSGSMHAYASDDPVFVAMNKRGLREDPDLGLFCVNCHAPMAVAKGTLTEDNVADFDPAQLSPAERGITCYFCHNVEQVTQDHNNGLVLAMDSTMRGGLADPVDSPAHQNKYDPLMDSDLNKSEMCGSCHDIVNGHGVRIERTFAEWKDTIFGKSELAERNLSCGACHMESSYGLVADGPDLGTTVRDKPVLHSHLFAGIDQALTPFPETEAQTDAIKRILDGSLTIKGPVNPNDPSKTPGGICVGPEPKITVRISNVGSGHAWPSGSAFDRRAWLEVIAYRADNSIAFQSGVVPDGMDPEDIGDPNLLGMWDRVYKPDGSPAHFFWDIARSDPQFLVPGPTTLIMEPELDHVIIKTFDVPNIGEIARVTARVRIRALSYSLLRELVASGDLAAGIEAELQTFDVRGTIRTWDVATAGTGNAERTRCSPR
jgi:hypothetical protein